LLDVVLVLYILGRWDIDLATLYYPGPGSISYSLTFVNLYVPDLNTGCGLDIYKILISSVSLETTIFSPF
jgi:hypothetical protein